MKALRRDENMSVARKNALERITWCTEDAPHFKDPKSSPDAVQICAVTVSYNLPVQQLCTSRRLFCLKGPKTGELAQGLD